jgi:hypothetical protein
MYTQLRSDDWSKNIVLDGEKNVFLLRIFEMDTVINVANLKV